MSQSALYKDRINLMLFEISTNDLEKLKSFYAVVDEKSFKLKCVS
jgi:hypothetical protein